MFFCGKHENKKTHMYFSIATVSVSIVGVIIFNFLSLDAYDFLDKEYEHAIKLCKVDWIIFNTDFYTGGVFHTIRGRVKKRDLYINIR